MDIIEESKKRLQLEELFKVSDKTEIINLGSLKDQPELPALIPNILDTSLLLNYDKNYDQAIRYFEFLASQIIVSGWNVEIIIYDENLSSGFSFLEKIQRTLNVQNILNSKIEFIRSSDALRQKFEELWSISLERKSQLLARDQSWVEFCRINQSEVNNFKFIVLSNDVRLFDSRLQSNLIEMIKHSYNFGLNFIILNDESYQIEEEGRLSQDRKIDFLNKVSQAPALTFNLENDKISVFGSQYYTSPFEIYEKFNGVKPYFLDDSAYKALNDMLQESDDAHKDYYEDYISIDVGSLESERFSISFGQRSDIFNALLAGTRNSGKSTFLKHLIISICEKYRPEDVMITIHDQSKGSYIFNQLPQIDIVDVTNGIDGIRQLLSEFHSEFNSRMHMFNNAQQEGFCGELNLYDYNRWALENGKQKLPVRILIFDELGALLESLKEVGKRGDIRDFSSLLDRYVKLYRKAGFMLILCSQTFDDDFISDLKSNIRLRMSLKVGEKSASEAIFERRNHRAYNLVNDSHQKEVLINKDSGRIDANKVITLDYMNNQILTERINKILLEG